MSSVTQLKSEQSPSDIAEQLSAALDLQKTSFNQSPAETANERIEHLKTLKRLMVENREPLMAAINKDYGNRSYHESLLADYITCISDIDHSIKHLKGWMKVQKRSVDFIMYPGVKNRVIPQPLGVVGVIVPWNFPLAMVMTQLSAIFAAGNRAMVKMSENSQTLAALLKELCEKYFIPEKLQFFEETGSVGIEFSKLPFDHIIFTGSAATGKKVMAAAAQNLTPVTLELGGKSPAIIDPNYPLARAVERILFAKQFNAGQICTTVDYVFVHKSQRDEFIKLAKSWADKHIPDIASTDYTSVIDDASFKRIENTVEEARKKGAEIINLCNQEALAELRKYPLTLVLDGTNEMEVQQREIFGPVLLVMTYETQQEVVDYVNSRPRPLAMYPFTDNNSLCDFYIENIMSGGVTVNDAVLHVGQMDLPFGGVGESGMGHYHGYEGFTTFSKMRPIMYQAKATSIKLLSPPYSKGLADKILNFISKLKE